MVSKAQPKVFRTLLAIALTTPLCPIAPTAASAEEADTNPIIAEAEASSSAENSISSTAQGRDGESASDVILKQPDNPAIKDVGTENSGSQATPSAAQIEESHQATVALSESNSSNPIVDWTPNGTCEWMIDAEGCLMIRPSNGAEEGKLESFNSYAEVPWLRYNNYIFKVKFLAKTVAPSRINSMFYGCSNLRSADFANFDMSNVEDANNIFRYCKSLKSFDFNPSSAPTSIALSDAFDGCSALQSISFSGLAGTYVNQLNYAFYDCESLQTFSFGPLDTSRLEYAYQLLEGCTSIKELDFSENNLTNLKDFHRAFARCDNLQSIELPSQAMISLDNVSECFDGCSSLKEFSLASFSGSKISNMSGLFAGCSRLNNLDLSPLNTSHTIDMSNLFAGCSSLERIDLSTFNTSLVADMSSMFAGCSKIKTLNVTTLKTSNVTNMRRMFLGCSSLRELDLSNFDTSNVVYMGGGYLNNPTYFGMFSGCSSLESIDLSPLDTSNVLQIGYEGGYDNGEFQRAGMFSNCTSLTHINLSVLDLSRVQTMGHLFYGCSALSTVNMSTNTRALTDAGAMFQGCAKLSELDLTAFDASNITVTRNMFESTQITKVSLGAKSTSICPYPGGPGETGMWVDLETGKTYTCDAIPDGIENTYYAQCELSDCLFQVDLNNEEYTGKPIEKALKSNLVQGLEYTVTYQNNLKVGTATITINGIGRTSGTVQYQFNIIRSNTAYDVPDDLSALFGDTLERVILPDGFNWQEDLSTVVGDPGDNIHPASYTPRDTDNYNIIYDIPVTVRVTRPIDAAMFALTQPDITYNGSALEPLVRSDIVPEGSYTVEYQNNVNAGKAIATITGQGNYTGSCELPFVIQKAKPSYKIPTAIEAARNQTLTDLTLPEGFSWQDDSSTPVGDSGKHTFMAMFTPKDADNYNIVRDIPITVSVAYDIVPIPTPANLVYDGSLQYYPIADSHINVISDNGGTNVGEYSALLSLANPSLDKWEDSTWEQKEIAYRIEPAQIRDANIDFASSAYTGKAIEPTIHASFNNADLHVGQDFAINYRDNVNAGEATAIITGIGNFTGSCELNFTIDKADPAYTIPKTLIGTFGETIGSIALPEGFSWQNDPATRIDWRGNKALKITYTPADMANYNVVRDIPVTVFVEYDTVDIPVISSFVYSGQLQKPALDSDPRITVLANTGGTNAGTYAATIALANPTFDRWADGTSDAKTICYEINPADISSVNFSDIPDTALENGKAEPIVYASFNETPLQVDKDFTVSYENNTQVGTSAAIVSGKGNFSGTKSIAFHIGIADISSCKPAIYDTPIVYQGEPVTPRVYLAGPNSGITLHDGIDYEVTYADNNAIGTATATLRGIGDYVGSVTATFEIVDKINLADATCRADSCAFYTGEPIKQPVHVHPSGTYRDYLTEGVDYNVTYEKNINPGRATAIVRGIGRCTGEARCDFSIIRKGDYSLSCSSAKVSLSGENRYVYSYTTNTFLYTGNPVAPRATVYLKVGSTSMQLTEGVDFTVSYSDNDAVGTGYITIAGINGLEGSVTESFTISKTLPISALNLSPIWDFDQIDYDLSSESPVKPKLIPSPFFVEDADYDLSYSNCDKTGTGFVTITGRGHYTGSATLSVCIVDKHSRLLLQDCAADAVPDQVYTGNPIKPTITVRDANGRALDNGLEYEPQFYDNVNAGTANATIAQGAGFTTYDGYLQTSFNILPAEISNAIIDPIKDQRLHKTAPEPDPNITFNGKKLQNGVDYEVAYENNDAVGIATATITGKGNFTGTITASFYVMEYEMPYDDVLNEFETKTIKWSSDSGRTLKFTLLNGGVPWFIVNTVQGLYNAKATILDDQDTEIYSFSLQSPQQYGAMALPAGNYYLRLEGSVYGGSALCVLHYAYANGLYGQNGNCVYEKEDNAPWNGQTIAEVATPVKPNSRFIGTAYMPSKPADTDYYALTVAKPTNVEFDFTARQSFQFDLVDGSGQTIEKFDADGHLSKMTHMHEESTVHMNCGMLEPGTYYVKVSPLQRDAIGTAYYCDVTATPSARIAGDEAANTASRIALGAFPEGSEWVVVARDDDFADAMSATGLAGALNAPIVLTDRFGLSDAAADAVQKLGAKKAYVIGGKGAIPADLESQLAGAGCQVQGRVYGECSWDTSVECAKKIAEHGGNPNGDAVVAMSGNFQDALSISSFAYKYQVPILLETDEANGRRLTDEAASLVAGLAGTVYVPGGTGAVPESSVEGVFGASRVVRLAGWDGYDTSNQIATYMVDHGLLSASAVCLASGAPDPKGVDALAGAALAGKSGGVVLLTNTNARFGDVSTTTVEGFDSEHTPAFLASHAGDVNQAYILGGKAVMPADLQQKVNDILG